MKNNFLLCMVCVMSSLVGGALGGYGFLSVQHRKGADSVLRAQKLELMDSEGKVRASFGVGQDKTVSLRMFARASTPAIELSVPGEVKEEFSSTSSLIFRNTFGVPLVSLRAIGGDRGSLAFVGPLSFNQVVVGYSPVGDYDGGHDLSSWGLTIVGPNHSLNGLNLFTQDGKSVGFSLEPKDAPVFRK